MPIEDIVHAGSSLLAEAIGRLRAGQVIRESGYDGEYGVIRLFQDGELKRLTAGSLLFDAPIVAPRREAARTPAPIGIRRNKQQPRRFAEPLVVRRRAAQRRPRRTSSPISTTISAARPQ